MPDQILISNETHALVKDSIVCEKKEEITVKGIAYPIQTYQVVGLRDKFAKDEIELRKEHKGFLLSLNYEKMDKEQALDTLRTAIEQIQNQ